MTNKDKYLVIEGNVKTVTEIITRVAENNPEMTIGEFISKYTPDGYLILR